MEKTVSNNKTNRPSFVNQIGISTNIFNNPETLLPLVNNLSANFSVLEIEFENTLKNIFQYDTATLNHWLEPILALKEKNQLTFSVHAPYVGRMTDIAASDTETRET